MIGFLIGLDRPGDAIYVTGDTVWYDGVAEVAERYRPRLVIMFTGSAKTRGAIHLTMDSNDAIATAHAFPEAALVAIHNEGWAHFTESEDDLARAFATLAGPPPTAAAAGRADDSGIKAEGRPCPRPP